jgi:hypothetical protein
MYGSLTVTAGKHGTAGGTGTHVTLHVTQLEIKYTFSLVTPVTCIEPMTYLDLMFAIKSNFHSISERGYFPLRLQRRRLRIRPVYPGITLAKFENI